MIQMVILVILWDLDISVVLYIIINIKISSVSIIDAGCNFLVVVVTIVVTYKNGYKEYIVMTYYNRNTLFEIDHTTTIDANDHTCYYKIFM